VKAHEVIDLLTALKSLDPRGFVTVDDTTISVWTSVLNREPSVSAHDAMQAAYELVAQPDAVFPTPGQFRAMVAETVSGLPGVADARAQIERAMRENYPGMLAKYTPDALVLNAVRRIGGVTMFRNSRNEIETARLWKEFEAAYRSLRDAQVSPRQISTDPALPGVRELGEPA
jgi:hypothetical protein